MAKTHEIVSHDESSVPQYDDGAIVTMRIGGHIGALPYRQYPEMSKTDDYAFQVGRRYLAERKVQSELARAVKAGEVDRPGKPTSPEFIADRLAKWVPADESELTTVGSLRADVAREYLRRAFKLGTSATDDARINGALMGALAHPKHSVEIAKLLAAKFAEYIAPKKRDEKGAGAPESVEALDLDAA
jgi:hypothetical protein